MNLKIFLFSVLNIVLISVQSLNNRDVTEPDMIRNTYLKVEKTLCDSFVNDPKKSRNDRLKSIFIDHNNFVNTFLKDHIAFDDLKTLIRSNEWHVLESEIISVHRMFKSFQQHLNRESKLVEKGNFNDEVSLDLTEHVLEDSNWPLKDAVENLHRVVVQEKLFFGKVSVSSTIKKQLHE